MNAENQSTPPLSEEVSELERLRDENKALNDQLNLAATLLTQTGARLETAEAALRQQFEDQNANLAYECAAKAAWKTEATDLRAQAEAAKTALQKIKDVVNSRHDVERNQSDRKVFGVHLTDRDYKNILTSLSSISTAEAKPEPYCADCKCRINEAHKPECSFWYTTKEPGDVTA